MYSESIMLFFVWLILIGLLSAGISALLLRTRKPLISRIYALFTISLGLIIIIIMSLLFTIMLFQRHPQTTPLDNMQNTKIANLSITTSVPFSVIKEHSSQFTTSIHPLFQAPEGNQNETQTTIRPTPVGTPGVSIADAFGPGYAVSAKARLSASAFDVDPKEQLEQSLDQNGSVTFVWTATPKYIGKQSLEVTITGVWTPSSGGTPKERPLAHQSLSLDVVDIPPPPPPSFFLLGQVDLGALLGVLLGSAFNVPVIIELIKIRHERKQERQQISRTPSSRKRKHRP